MIRSAARTPFSCALALVVGLAGELGAQQELPAATAQVWERQLVATTGQDDMAGQVLARGDRVYVIGTLSGVEEYQGLVRAYDAFSGALLWSERVGADTTSTASSGGGALSAGGETLFVGFHTFEEGVGQFVNVVAFDTSDGSERWTEALAIGSKALASNWSQIAADPTGQRVFATTTAYTVVVDPNATPVIQEVHVIRAHALDAITGAALWSGEVDATGLGNGVDVVATGDGARVIVGATTTSGVTLITGETDHRFLVRAFDAITGAAQWTYQTAPQGASQLFDLALADGGGPLVAAGDATHVDNVVALNPATGAVQWSRTLGILQPRVALSSDGSRGAIAGLSALDWPSKDARVAGLTTLAGDVAWETGLSLELPSESGYATAVTLAGDGASVYVAGYLKPGPLHSDAFAGRMDFATGSESWFVRTTGPYQGAGGRNALVVNEAHQRVVFTTSTESLASPTNYDIETISFDEATGAIHWRDVVDLPQDLEQGTRTLVESPDGSAVFVASRASKIDHRTEISALSAADGTTLWERTWPFAFAPDPEEGIPLVVSADGQRLFAYVSSDSGTSLVGLDAQDGSDLWQRDFETFDRGWSLAVSPDGSRVHATFLDWVPDTADVAKQVRTYDAATGADVWTWTSDTPTDLPGRALLDLSADGSRLAYAEARPDPSPLGGDKGIVTRVLDADSGQALWTKTFHQTGTYEEELHSIHLSPDGSTVYVVAAAAILSAFFEGEVVLLGPFLVLAYDVATGNQLWVHQSNGPPHAMHIAHLAAADLVPDGGRLLLAGMAVGISPPRFPFVRALDTATGQILWHVEPDLPGGTDAWLHVGRSGEGGASFVLAGEFDEFLPGGAPGQRGFFAAYDTALGDPLWTVQLPDLTASREPSVVLGAAGGHNAYYAGSLRQGATDAQDLYCGMFALPTLLGEPGTVSASAGGVHELDLRAGTERAGQVYLLLGSSNGTTPGLDFGTAHLPLNVDGYFHATLVAPNAPPLSASLGVLDPSGRAAAAFTLPHGALPQLAGHTFHHAYLTVDTGGLFPVLDHGSNAVAVTVAP